MPSHRLLMAIFFMQPIAMGAWLRRIPQVQEKLHLDHMNLSLALIGMAIGTLSALPIGGRLVAAVGARAIIVWGLPAFLVAICLPALAWDQASLFFSLVLAGITIAIVELGMNVAADAQEKSSGKLIMSSSHGCWSLGIMIGSLCGAAQAGWGLSPSISMLTISTILLAPSITLALTLSRSLHVAETAGDEVVQGFKFPHPILLGICAFTFGITMAEGAVADWSAIFLRDVFAAEPATAGFGYAVFAGMVASGRFAGDWLRRRLGPALLAQVCGAVAVTGASVLFLSFSLPVALLGFAMIGLGVCVGFPLGVTAAASAPGRSPASNVAILSFVALTGFLIGPPAIGFFAQATDIRTAMALLIPVLAISALLAGLLKSGTSPRSCEEDKKRKNLGKQQFKRCRT